MNFSEITPPSHHGKADYAKATPEAQIGFRVDDLVSDALKWAPFVTADALKGFDWRGLNESAEDVDALKLLLTAESVAQAFEQDLLYPMYIQRHTGDSELTSVMQKYDDRLKDIGFFRPMFAEHGVMIKSEFSADTATPLVASLALKKLVQMRLEGHAINPSEQFSQVPSTEATHLTRYDLPLTQELSMQVILFRRREKEEDRAITTNTGTFSYEFTVHPVGFEFSNRLRKDLVVAEQEHVDAHIIQRAIELLLPSLTAKQDEANFFSEEFALTYQLSEKLVKGFTDQHADDYHDITPEDHDQSDIHLLKLVSKDGLYTVGFTWSDDKTIHIQGTRTSKFYDQQAELQLEFIQKEVPKNLFNRLNETSDAITHRFTYPYAIEDHIPSIVLGRMPWSMINDEVRKIFPLPEEIQQWISGFSANESQGNVSPDVQGTYTHDNQTIQLGWRVHMNMKSDGDNSTPQFEPQVYCWKIDKPQ